jgi:hypothetical protein
VKAKKLPLLVAVLVLVAASVALGACSGGSSSDEKALFEKVTAMWRDKDAAAATELFAADATLYWNWPVPSGTPAGMQTGIEEINTLVASGDMGAPTLYGDAVYTLDIPADKDVQYISANYKGARFIAAPVYVGTELYMVVLEVRDGKVQNHFVEALH